MRHAKVSHSGVQERARRERGRVRSFLSPFLPGFIFKRVGKETGIQDVTLPFSLAVLTWRPE